MDFKFHILPWHEDEAYVLAAGSVEIPPSYTEYFRKLNGLGINLTPDQKAWYIKKAEQQQVR
jgi:hypothetical protein